MVILWNYMKKGITIDKKTGEIKIKQEEEEPKEPETKICPYCLTEIKYKAVRCPHCTSELEKMQEEIAEKID